jgi:hypothetical protein
VESDIMRVIAPLAVAAFGVFAAKHAMDHAAVEYFHVRSGHSTNPRADMGLVWVFTLTAISAICTVMGTFLAALQVALR